MPQNPLRESLIQLGVEKLADALLELSANHEEARNLVQRLVATPKDNIQRYKKRLSSIKRRQKFVHWNESKEFAGELESVLDDLEAGVNDPKTGVELVSLFFQADNSIFERCDDSNGWIGDVFRETAQRLFSKYASGCEDTLWLIKQFMTLYGQDDYGVRSYLIDDITKYLPGSAMDEVIRLFWDEVGQQKKKTLERQQWLTGLESIAKQLKNPELFKEARLEHWGELNANASLEVAEIYLDSGNAKEALVWAEKVQDLGPLRMHDTHDLLLKIYKELGDTEKESEIAWELFRAYRSQENFTRLIEVIGENQRDTVIQDQCDQIMEGKDFFPADTQFLIDVGLPGKAGDYLIKHHEQLNGDFYVTLVPLAESMEESQNLLPASVVYRALLDSILARGVSKYYYHGVKYLKRLDLLANSVEDWKMIEPHQDYKNNLHATHKRKSSFWSRYKTGY